MRIGGTPTVYAELRTKEDITEAIEYCTKKALPMVVLGSGSNTIFADGEIHALVVRILHDAVTINEDRVTVGAGKILASLMMELKDVGLDLSPLTGIPGTVGGAIFGNAGQGPIGIWIDAYIESVTAFIDGSWTTLSREECDFRYRHSRFKDQTSTPILWEATLRVPRTEPSVIASNIDTLIKRRIETQPHRKTAGSCFTAVNGVPAWKLIDAAGLRGYRSGDIEISDKHANFLINCGQGTYKDTCELIKHVRTHIPGLTVEMRFFGSDGRIDTSI